MVNRKQRLEAFVARVELERIRTGGHGPALLQLKKKLEQDDETFEQKVRRQNGRLLALMRRVIAGALGVLGVKWSVSPTRASGADRGAPRLASVGGPGTRSLAAVAVLLSVPLGALVLTQPSFFADRGASAGGNTVTQPARTSLGSVVVSPPSRSTRPEAQAEVPAQEGPTSAGSTWTPSAAKTPVGGLPQGPGAEGGGPLLATIRARTWDGEVLTPRNTEWKKRFLREGLKKSESPAVFDDRRCLSIPRTPSGVPVLPVPLGVLSSLLEPEAVARNAGHSPVPNYAALLLSFKAAHQTLVVGQKLREDLRGWAGVDGDKAMELAPLVASAFLHSKSWKPTPQDGGKLSDDGIMELPPIAMPLAAPWPAAAASAKAYRAAVVIYAPRRTVLETEKNATLYKPGVYVVQESGMEFNRLDPLRGSFVFSSDADGVENLFVTMRGDQNVPTIFYHDIVMDMHARQRRMPGYILSEYYSTDDQMKWFSGTDIVVPFRSVKGADACLVFTTLCYDLAAYDGKDDDDRARQEQIRQSLGNWKRLAERGWR